MATIQINPLNPAGSDLFTDSESFMRELSDTEMTIQGGSSPVCISLTVIFSVNVVSVFLMD